MPTRIRATLALLFFALPATLSAQSVSTAVPAPAPDSRPSSGKTAPRQNMLTGTVTDSLGSSIPGANVELLNAVGKVVATTVSGGAGRYSVALASAGRYRIRAWAASFRPALSDAEFASGDHPAEIDVVLSPASVAQQVVVTATGVPTPELQTGASVSVIGERELATRRDVDQELPLQPGAQITHNGQAGAVGSLFLRGGPSDSTKILIDGVPVNDLGGYFNFANLSAAGLRKAELYRGPDSALYGSDALSGVLLLETRRGTTPLPEFNYRADGGTFGTLHQEASVGGAWRRFDYFTDAARYNTQNSTPNSEFHSNTYLGNLGWQLLPSTGLRATVRRFVSAFNSANAVDLYGIPDNAVSREHDTSFGVTLQNRVNDRWHNLVRYAGLRLRSGFATGLATGIPYDPYSTGFPVYLGKVMTIRGANGYQVNGAAILQYSQGPSQSSALTDRDSIYAQTDYRWNDHLAALLGFRYEAEGGVAYGFSNVTTSRGNYSYMTQLSGEFGNRLYYTVGSGLENNAVFGFAATPRASLAFHLVRPRDQGIFSGTRLVFNFAKGIKEPSIYNESNSIYDLLQTLPAQPGYPSGPEIIAQYGIQPFRAERSRTYDGGLQQMFDRGRARLSLTYFHNEFDGQPEYVPYQSLAQFGVPQGVIDALSAANPYGDAVINSLAYRAQGAEVEIEYRLSHRLAARGGWTYTDAVVQHSFSGLMGNAAQGTSFPNIAIGAYSPLNGARPFRIAPHTGFISLDWSARRYFLRLTGTFVSRRDDSDFLADANFGNTLLLPNRNLDPAYQRIGLYGSFQLAPHLSVYTSMENLLNQRYYEAFGYPALPFTIRSGMHITLGGDSWKL